MRDERPSRGAVRTPRAIARLGDRHSVGPREPAARTPIVSENWTIGRCCSQDGIPRDAIDGRDTFAVTRAA